MTFKEGEVVIHKRYGKATVLKVYEPNEDYRFGGGVLLELTPKGLDQLNYDRGTLYAKGQQNEIKYCFEDNTKMLEVKES